MGNHDTIYGKMKKQGFIIVHEVIIAVCCIMLMGVTYMGSKTIINYRVERTITECDAIDAALQAYGRTHHTVLRSTVAVVNNQLRYGQSPAYPASLNELTYLQNESGAIVKNIDLSKFIYTVRTNSAGEMEYHLGVELPNGKNYTSRLSDY